MMVSIDSRVAAAPLNMLTPCLGLCSSHSKRHIEAFSIHSRDTAAASWLRGGMLNAVPKNSDIAAHWLTMEKAELLVMREASVMVGKG